MLRDVYHHRNKTITKPIVDLMDDEDGDDFSRPNKERDYLAKLVSDHATIISESYWNSLSSGDLISSGVIIFL